MDARTWGRVAIAALAFVAAACAHAEADTDVLAGIDGGFEGTNDGWVVTGGTLVAANTPPAPHGGIAAGRVTATGTSVLVLSSQVWRVPSEPAAHTLVLWLYDNDPRIAPLVELGFHDASFQLIGIPHSVTPGGDQAAWRRVTVGPATAPAGTVYAKVTVRGTPSAAGATLFLDDATLVRGAPIPTPTPSPTPEPTASPTATASAASTATATATAAATPLATAAAVPTVISTPIVPAVFATLQNGDFERSGLYGWTVTGGIATQVTPGLGGSAYAALLTSDTTSTKFLQQAVTVAPLGWYAATAHMRLSGSIEAAWLRIAWYASPLAEGAQLRTVDSPLLTVRDQVLDAGTGPVRAPAEARSARIRIMLRPLGIEAAHVTVDDVRFEPTTAPTPTPTSTPVATSTPAPTASPAPLPTPVPTPPALVASVSMPPSASARVAAVPSPTLAPGKSSSIGPLATTVAVGAVLPAARAGTTAAAAMLRITELLPDPAEPGNDADFEWVELANFGGEPASLAGVLLADNQGAIALPGMTLSPGMVLVVAGLRAAVPEASAYRPPQGFSNGLANGGDRLALFLPDRTVIDALSYGADTTYDRPPLPSPGPGSSLIRRFADDGTYAGFEVAAKPSPGKLEPRVTATPGATTDAAAGGADVFGSAALALVGVGALGAAGVQRYRVVRGESAPSTSR